jgi:hypothetical protein
MAKLVILQNKFDKRIENFTAVVSDVKIEDADAFGGGIKTELVFEFGEDEPLLKLDMKLDKWVDDGNGGRTPRTSSTIYKFFKSCAKLDIEFDFNDDYTEVTTTPSLLGKEVSFEVQAKSFVPDPSEVDAETGDPRTVTFYIWKVAAIKGNSSVTPSKPAPAATVEAKPVDLEAVKKNWLNIVSGIPEKCQFSGLLAAKNDFVKGKVFSAEETAYYSEARKVKSMIDMLVAEGFLTKKGVEYTKNDDKILEGLM